MLALTASTRCFVALVPVDLRRGFDGLSAHVQTVPASPPPRTLDTTPVAGSLRSPGPLTLEEVSTRPEERAEVRALRACFHYLGYRAPAGENLQYRVSEETGRLLAVMVFPSAAWKGAARDRWVGWTPRQREAGPGKIAHQSRFLIPPWVQVPCLASPLLGGVARRIGGEWERKHGNRVMVLETFVESGRFRGTWYRADNWRSLGTTTGRSRQDRQRTLQVPLKEVFALPLRADFREELQR